MDRMNPLQRAFLKEDSKSQETPAFKKPSLLSRGPELDTRKQSTHLRIPNVSHQPGCSTLPRGPDSASENSQKRQKVMLKPGCGPLDWADLQATKGLSGELIIEALVSIKDWETFTKDNEIYERNLIPVLKELCQKFPNHKIPREALKKYPPILPWEFKPAFKIRLQEVQLHNTKEDMWCILDGKVYSLSKYLDFHPGGDEILSQYCNGKNATIMFAKYHRWVNYEKLLQTFYIGDVLRK